MFAGNATDTRPLAQVNDFTDSLNDNLGEYNPFNASPYRQITPPESDMNVQYTFFDNNLFDANRDASAF